MSKKKTRVSEAAKVSTTATQTKRPSRYMSASEFNPDYSYVVKDLRRIGILAGSFFIVLIILSIFLR